MKSDLHELHESNESIELYERNIRGARKSCYYKLTDDEISEIKISIRTINADEDIFIFNSDEHLHTSYLDATDIVIINGDVLPTTDASESHPRSIMSARAVISHEYYGHRSHRGTPLLANSWEDEYNASRTAAETTPNLTDEERRHLVMDALERKREAGIVPVLDGFERRILYGESY